MVSMQSIHFFRWTEQLKDSGHEVFWFDILDGGDTNKLPWVRKYINWKYKYPNLKGRHFLKKQLPIAYKLLTPVLEYGVESKFRAILNEVKPDVVHSFVLYMSCVPILKVMQGYKQVKWLYSSWGSDLYYFKNIPKNNQDIRRVLKRVNYLITDCKRDVNLAGSLGFKGKVLGTFPGGGGFTIKAYEQYVLQPVLDRKVILVKGYQGRSGRSINVIKALRQSYNELKGYKVVVFSADKALKDYINKNTINNLLDIKVYSRERYIPHETILKLMGSALVYIGNSNSDGMPNTLLEAIIQGAFPIQSNPGGASAEVVVHKKNGLLIDDCENVELIKQQVVDALSNDIMILKAFEYNQKHIKPNLEREVVMQAVLKAYSQIEL